VSLFEQIRRAELEMVIKWLPPSGRILELGGANGFQAHLLENRGYQVVSLDIADPRPDAPVYHRVQRFDGRNLPFQDHSFDAVFSSNVLEHVTDLPSLLAESRRVLRPTGIAIHVMPTPAWRFWTSLTHYLYLLRRLSKHIGSNKEPGRGNAQPATEGQTSTEVGDTPPKRYLRWLQYLRPGPHGESRSALQELYSFGSRRWRRELERHGFSVDESAPIGLFYTGHLVLPRMTVDRRRALAPLLGSAGRIYIAHPAPDPGSGPAPRPVA
jgi:SAM-dependent methyltransferase